MLKFPVSVFKFSHRGSHFHFLPFFLQQSNQIESQVRPPVFQFSSCFKGTVAHSIFHRIFIFVPDGKFRFHFAQSMIYQTYCKLSLFREFTNLLSGFSTQRKKRPPSSLVFGKSLPEMVAICFISGSMTDISD